MKDERTAGAPREHMDAEHPLLDVIRSQWLREEFALLERGRSAGLLQALREHYARLRLDIAYGRPVPPNLIVIKTRLRALYIGSERDEERAFELALYMVDPSWARVRERGMTVPADVCRAALLLAAAIVHGSYLTTNGQWSDTMFDLFECLFLDDRLGMRAIARQMAVADHDPAFALDWTGFSDLPTSTHPMVSAICLRVLQKWSKIECRRALDLVRIALASLLEFADESDLDVDDTPRVPAALADLKAYAANGHDRSRTAEIFDPTNTILRAEPPADDGLRKRSEHIAALARLRVWTKYATQDALDASARILAGVYMGDNDSYWKGVALRPLAGLMLHICYMAERVPGVRPDDIIAAASAIAREAEWEHSGSGPRSHRRSLECLLETLSAKHGGDVTRLCHEAMIAHHDPTLSRRWRDDRGEMTPTSPYVALTMSELMAATDYEQRVIVSTMTSALTQAIRKDE